MRCCCHLQTKSLSQWGRPEAAAAECGSWSGGLDIADLELLLTLMAAKHHIKVSKVIPLLLTSELGQPQATLADWWLPDTTLCLDCAEALISFLKQVTQSMAEAAQ